MNATLVIFGASGDLTGRKLIPALYRERETLGTDIRIVGMARTKWSDDAWRESLATKVRQFVPGFDPDAWSEFASRIFYVPGSLESMEDLMELETRIGQIEPESRRISGDSSGNGRTRVYDLAISPALYVTAVRQLAAAGMFVQSRGPRRLVLEKPFGTDLDSARTLHRQLREVLDESQIFRIDHYLGKETVRNLHSLWFANEFLEPLRCREHVETVEITAMESVGVERRGAYYDRSGVLRDMFQNHLIQLLTLTATEPPERADANAIRDEKVRVLRAVHIPTGKELREAAVFGQYQGYRTEPDISAQSRTPTFAALRLAIDNSRWRGVPFYLRSGKSAGCATTQIVFRLRRPSVERIGSICPHGVCDGNRLVIPIQPAEGVHLDFLVRQPGAENRLRPATLNFRFSGGMPDAYQKLLVDAIRGDASLFIRSDETEKAWEILDPFIRLQEQDPTIPVHGYEPGVWGPPESGDWIASHGAQWYDLCPVL
ncbi:MAG: glucose-6-phosphate dehydrogenase [Planctomycetia bacterium]|nr:glucose-6-phosphate dehydrogenase [Planctomycetia bacterium]